MGLLRVSVTLEGVKRVLALGRNPEAWCGYRYHAHPMHHAREPCQRRSQHIVRVSAVCFARSYH